MNNKHIEYSSFREKLIEHLFISELLKIAWQKGDCHLEVAKPEVDNAGYDVIIEANGIIRHIQLKASYLGGKTSRQNVHVRLAGKPSGCVVWVYFDEETLELGPFFFFGSAPGVPLPSLENTKTAKHTKADSGGNKSERPNIREVNKALFTSYESAKDIFEALFSTEL